MFWFKCCIFVSNFWKSNCGKEKQQRDVAKKIIKTCNENKCEAKRRKKREMKQQNVKRRWMTTIFLVAASAAAAVFFTRRYDLCCCLFLARTYCVRTFTHKRWSDIALFVYCVCSIRLFLFVYMQYRQTGFVSATNERNSGRDFYCFHTHKTNEMEKIVRVA